MIGLAEYTEKVKSYTRAETLREAVALLDGIWNCNCVTDESLGRSKCNCADAPVNRSGVRKLMEEAQTK